MSLQGLGGFDVSKSMSTNSRSGLGGLGALSQNNSVDDNSIVCCTAEQFGNDINKYSPYIRDWFAKCNAVTLYESDNSVKSLLKNFTVFNLSIVNDTVPYIVITAINGDMAGDIAVRFANLQDQQSSLVKTKKIIICPTDFNTEEKQEALATNIELIGLAELRDIDSAKRGIYKNNYQPSSFMDKLCRNMAYNYNAEHGTVGSSSGYGMDALGDSIGNVFSESVSDIKNSLSGLFGKKNAPQNSNNTQNNNSGFGENLRNKR